MAYISLDYSEFILRHGTFSRDVEEHNDFMLDRHFTSIDEGRTLALMDGEEILIVLRILDDDTFNELPNDGRMAKYHHTIDIELYPILLVDGDRYTRINSRDEFEIYTEDSTELT